MSLQKMQKGLLLLGVLMVSLLACHKDNSAIKEPESLERAAEMARIYNGLYAEGVINVTQGKENSENILQGSITTSAGKMKMFTLQHGQDILKDIPQDGKYEILYLQHLLILNNKSTGQKYLLVGNQEESTKILKDLPSSYSKDIIVLPGYGLGMSFNQVAGARPADDLCAQSGCTVGTSSCNNACCGISCNAGYYACCQSTCRCKENPKT